MRVFILFCVLSNIFSYNIPNVNSFSVKNSEFSNKRFPVKLDPLAEYRRAQFYETRKKIFNKRKNNKKKYTFSKNSTSIK